ncbi:MAG: cobaltochelatase subunit CobN [Peptostreptococcaceae bacterium]|nr:cobaltochelatase subunit CobN [Peptostreptococcaceae bacterium]
MKITVVSVSLPACRGLRQAVKNWKEDPVPDLVVLDGKSRLSEEDRPRWEERMTASDLIIVDLMGSPKSVVETVHNILQKTKADILPIGGFEMSMGRLGSFEPGKMSKGSSGEMSSSAMKNMSRMKAASEALGKILPGPMRDMRNFSLCHKYFKMASESEMRELLLLLMREYGGAKDLPKPAPPTYFEGLKVRREGRTFEDMAEYESVFLREDKPSILIHSNAHHYPMDMTPVVEVLIERLAQDFYVIPVVTSGDYGSWEQELQKIIRDEKRLRIFLNLSPFRLAAGPMGGEFEKGIRLLELADVPYIHPYMMTRRSFEDWEDSIEGSTPSESLLSIVLPELDGASDTYPIGALATRGEEDYQEMEPIRFQIDRLAKRLKAMAELAEKSRAERKIAILCYNYPPGEANVFGGAFLDTFASVEKILRRLEQEGYGIDAPSKEQLMEDFGESGVVNFGNYTRNFDRYLRWPAKRYQTWSEEAGMLSATEAIWGKHPGKEMVDEKGDFLIPGKCYGNVFVGLQPARVRAEDAISYHDKKAMPHHQYQAFYQYLQEGFGADAVIHVGTHGTLEFLPGKEAGVSLEDVPSRLIGSMPHFYLYYCGNPSECVIAKRRIHGRLISYSPPVFQTGKLYGDYLALEEALEHFEQASTLNPAAVLEAENSWKALAEKLHLPTELEALEQELYRRKSALVPMGLHVFGEGFNEEEQKLFWEGYFSVGHRKEEEISAQDRARVAQNDEMDHLMAYLDGKYRRASLAGDIYRDPEILPTGQNLYQLDPRKVPSKAALARGAQAAKATLEHCIKEEGHLPSSVAVIMWGLETSRTQGEAFSQILHYIGAEYKQGGNLWQRSLRVIPIEELGRPRVDVTVNICGFFRDMFPNLLAELSEIIEQIIDREESLEDNPLKKHAQEIEAQLLEEGRPKDEARRLSRSRIFGPAEGEYGTGLTGLVESKNWQEESELGDFFRSQLSHVYNLEDRGFQAKGLYDKNLFSVEAISQIRSSQEYEITDLDHYYEFFGGLAKSVENVKGKKALMLITDSAGSTLYTETVDRAIERGITTRLLNPQWMEGMLKHDRHGVQQMADRFENLMGLEATTGAVEPMLYEKLFEQYINDEEFRKRLVENNLHSYRDILERMMEFSERGYWQATEEQREKIRSIYLELEDVIEERM